MNPLMDVFVPTLSTLTAFFLYYVTGAATLPYPFIRSRKIRSRLVAIVEHWSGWRKKYFSYLQGLIDYVELRSGRYVASGQTFDWLLRIAYFYPVAAYIIIWVVTGAATAGIAELLPDGRSADARLLTLVVLIAAIVVYRKIARAPWRTWAPLSICAVSLVLLASAIAGANAAFAVLAGVFCASSVSIIVNIEDVRRTQKSPGVARVFLGGALGGAVNGVVLYATSLSMAYAQAAFGLCLIAGIAFLFSKGGRNARERRHIGLFVAFQLMFFILLGILFSLYSSRLPVPAEFAAVYVMWGILPFLNAPFDWLSLVVTFFLVKSMINAEGVHLLMGSLVDIASAGVLMMLAMFGIMFYLALLYGITSQRGGVILLDPLSVTGAIGADFRSPAVYWLYFMASTTLFPTLFHLAAAALSFWMAASNRIVLPMVRLVVTATGDEEDDDLGQLAAGILMFVVATTFYLITAAFLLLIVFLVSLTVPYFVSGVTRVVEFAIAYGVALARWIA